jgi:hypothetical protein
LAATLVPIGATALQAAHFNGIEDDSFATSCGSALFDSTAASMVLFVRHDGQENVRATLKKFDMREIISSEVVVKRSVRLVIQTNVNNCMRVIGPNFTGIWQQQHGVCVHSYFGYQAIVF